MHPDPQQRPTALDVLEHGKVTELGPNPDPFILAKSGNTLVQDTVVKQQLFSPPKSSVFYKIVS